MQDLVLSRCDSGFERSGSSACRNSLESSIFSRGEIGSIGGEVCFVAVEMVEILVRVGSCKKDACDKKSDGGD